MRNKILVSLLLLMVSIGSSTATVDAQEGMLTQCAANAYTSLVSLPAGNLSVYLRASRAEDVGSTTVYLQQSQTGECVKVGIINNTLESWQKVGNVSVDVEGYGQLYVASPQQTQLYGSTGAPIVLLADDSTSPCIPVLDCSVTYEGQTFNLSPKKLSQSADALAVGLIIPIEGNQVENVVYSVDDIPAYVSGILGDFNTKYVGSGEHVLQRTVFLTSGAVLRDQTTLKQRGLKYDIQATLYPQKNLLKYIGIASVALLLYLVILTLLRIIYKRRQWRQTHIVQAGAQKPWVAPVFKEGVSYGELFAASRKWLFFGGGTVLIFVVMNMFVVSVFTVDGVSMYPTLQDNSRKPILKLPVTLAKINSGVYVPPRNEVVVVSVSDSSLFAGEGVSADIFVVKRVIGLPGERITVRDGKITVYNEENSDGFEPDSLLNWVHAPEPSVGYYIDITLGEGELFVVGDNRNESVDSRVYGPTRAENIIGRVL